MEAEYTWNMFCEVNKVPKTFSEYKQNHMDLDEEELDNQWEEVLEKYEKFLNCNHENVKVINEEENGYFLVECQDCGHQFVDG